MSHEIDMSNNRANMAYAGAVPWHGLGSKIRPNASIAEWRKAAGLEWEILEADVVGFAPSGAHASGEQGEWINCDGLNRKVLYRSDTKESLNVVGSGYHVVQPDEILEFIGDSVKAMGWRMETAGSLRNGKKIWALANIGAESEIGKGDLVKGYLLAATACDYSMGSEFMFTGVRVVCANTLSCAIEGRRGEPTDRVKVYHSTKIDDEVIKNIKDQLGIAGSTWERYIENAKRLARTKVSEKHAIKVLRDLDQREGSNEKVIEGESVRLSDEEYLSSHPTQRHILELFEGQAIGSELASAKGTAWGLVNAATQYYDWEARGTTDSRMNSAWFGLGAKKKQAFVDELLQYAD